MNDSIYIAATGMQAQQLSIDTIANNLANVNTPGFKKGRVSFQELMQVPSSHHAGDAPSLSAVGIGISAGNISRDFTTGALTQTGSNWDLAINGAGFLEVTMPDGSRGYSRGGTLEVSKEGYLTTGDGLVLKPAIHIPTNPYAITIAADGKVSVQATQQSTATDVGQIELANFTNPSALHPESGGIYTPTEASGEAIYGKPTTLAFGALVQGSKESSNVSLVDEMVTLMVTQRAYELSSKLVQASDEIMSMTNNLRR